MTNTYIGIIDAHGIESLTKKDSSRAVLLHLRAQHNRQRHATYFEVELEDVLADLLLKQAKEDPIKAGKTLKKAPNLRVPEEMCKSIKLIPNPKLDPYA